MFYAFTIEQVRRVIVPCNLVRLAYSDVDKINIRELTHDGCFWSDVKNLHVIKTPEDCLVWLGLWARSPEK